MHSEILSDSPTRLSHYDVKCWTKYKPQADVDGTELPSRPFAPDQMWPRHTQMCATGHVSVPENTTFFHPLTPSLALSLGIWTKALKMQNA